MRFLPFRPGRAAHLLALAAAALASPSAAAKRSPPRAIANPANEMTPRVSQCLIQRERGTIGKWLLTLPGSRAEARLVAGAEARFPACFDRWGHRTGDWIPQYDKAGMRAALVRALLQERRRTLPSRLPAEAAPPPYAPEAGDDPAAIVAADLGFCLARKHWTNVVTIVKAVDPAAENLWWESPKWKAARKREAAIVDSQLGKIIPSIAGCVPAGARLRIERERLRSLLEEAAYHLTNPAAAAGADPPRPKR